LKESKLVWIVKGHKVFADGGPYSLKVESLAKLVSKSKSSFYHHFSDLEIFIEELLAYHKLRAKQIEAKMRTCKNINPDFINVLIELQEDILFHRQLRIYRNHKQFKGLVEKLHHPIEQSFLPIWAKAIGLENNTLVANAFLKITVDNLFGRFKRFRKFKKFRRFKKFGRFSTTSESISDDSEAFVKGLEGLKSFEG